MTKDQAIIVAPANFTPTTVSTSGSGPYTFQCQESFVEKQHQFYLRVTFTGGFKMMTVDSSNLFTLNNIFVCTGSPVVSVNDTSHVQLIYGKGTGTK